MRFVVPGILIAIAIAVFFIFVTPTYTKLALLRKETGAYDEALGNSKALENERDKLTAKYNAFSPDELARLEKLLPENVDNIRLILEIEQLATPYGMALRDVKYDTGENEQAGALEGGVRRDVRKDYGTLELEFSTLGSYANFTSFLRDLENNLRIVDISSIQFSSNTAPASGALSDVYEYHVKVKTYWLKN